MATKVFSDCDIVKKKSERLGPMMFAVSIKSNSSIGILHIQVYL